MFDTYVRKEGDHTVTNVKQLPHDTADAARLYGECVAKAEKEVANATINKFGAHNNITCLTVETNLSFADNMHRVRVMFKLDGLTYDFIVREPHTVKDEVLQRIGEKVASYVVGMLSMKRHGL